VAQLPAYLEKIQHGAADIPVDLLPIMNDLRAASRVAAGDRERADGAQARCHHRRGAGLAGYGQPGSAEAVVRKRGRFHRHLLNWFRNEDVDDALRGSARCWSSFVMTSAGPDAAPAGRGRGVCLAMIESGEPPPAAVKSLFGKLDRVFKQVMDQGEESAMLDFPIDLLKNLLFYVSRSDVGASDSRCVEAVSRSGAGVPERTGQRLGAQLCGCRS
jgi:chemosensory pili system protein ChpA (sensor histidine kinase/response regulator)